MDDRPAQSKKVRKALNPAFGDQAAFIGPSSLAVCDFWWRGSDCL